MAKSTTIYVCENCGNEQLTWSGRCPMCDEWNTLRELRGAAKPARGGQAARSTVSSEVVELAEVTVVNDERITTGISEFDRTLGGGIVNGSVILIGGEPGIGKSTLLMQLAGRVGDILYVSGEESATQIKLRAQRLGVEKGVQLYIETDVTAITDTILRAKPKLVIIDSIQTLYDPTFPSTPGSIVQVRETALRVQQTAKQSGVPTIMVGHVTKEGGIAGPRTLEHLVDVVLYLEGERHHGARILRTVKNRFGATDEVGIFAMETEGLVPVDNPSGFMLAERRADAPGSAVGVTLEGTRPILIEVQALTNATSFGYPKRTASGFDLNRLNLLIAVLQKRAGINLSSHDVFVNIVGGLQIKEPALDLAVTMSLVSAYRNQPVPVDYALFGEVGLSGEIRSVQQIASRQSEAKRLGYPKTLAAKTVKQAIQELLGEGRNDA